MWEALGRKAIYGEPERMVVMLIGSGLRATDRIAGRYAAAAPGLNPA